MYLFSISFSIRIPPPLNIWNDYVMNLVSKESPILKYKIFCVEKYLSIIDFTKFGLFKFILFDEKLLISI